MNFAAEVTAWRALVARDLWHVVRSRSQLYSSIVTPLLLLVVLGTGVTHGLEPTNVREGDYSTFLMPGIIVMTALFASTFSSSSFYRDRDSGILRSLLVTPHSARSLMFGKALAGVVIGSLQSLLVLVVALVWPSFDLALQYGAILSILLAVGIVLLTNVFLAGVAQVLASRIHSMQGFHLVMNLVLFPLLFLSGAFYPLDNLPAWLRVLGRADPLAYAVEPLQLALYATSDEGYLPLFVSLGVLAAMTVAVILLGLRRPPRSTA